MNSFLKRSFVFIITFVLVFSMSISVCYASDTDSAESDPTGWNSWTLNEKISFVGKYGLDLISCFTGIVYGNPESMDELLRDTFAAKDGYGVSSYYEFLASNLGFDDSTETWELSDDLVSFLNDFITNYNDRVQMTYRYYFDPDNVDFSAIQNKDVHDELIRVMKEYPNLHFINWGSASEWGHGTAFWFGMNNNLSYAVSLNNNLGIFTKCSVFTSNWENPIPHVKICLLDTSRDDGKYWGYMPVNNPNSAVWNVSFEEIVELFENNGIASSTYPADIMYELTLAPNKTSKCNFYASTCVISSDKSAINTYKSVADMKKDTGNYTVGRYTDSYTGTTINNITQTEINNIVNNYYPSDPDPNPDDPGGGGGSSGSDSKDYTFLLQRIISEIQNLNFSDLNDTLKEIKVLVSNISQNLYDFSDMDSNISEMNNSIKDILEQLQDLNDNLVALARALVGKDTFEDALSGVKSNIPGPDDIILASVNELAELQEEALSFGGALGDIFSKLLDFQTGIDDLVQDEEYIDEVEDLLRQLLPKDPEDNEDDSFFDKVLKTIEMSLQLYANSVDEIKETSKKKFPFSIGYDIELLLMLLSAEPQTPVFTIPFEYDRINYKSEIVIDFSMFDDSIDVIRFFLTIYYCFFLLMITPKMIGLNNEVDS